MGRNSYLDFLKSLVGKRARYGRLLERLHGTPFRPLVAMDANRAADGERLRGEFLEKGVPQGLSFLPPGGCTVLELLIGVARRMEFDLLGSRHGRPAKDWFWVLVGNLELSWCDNVCFGIDASGTLGKIDRALAAFLKREHGPDGSGGLFPLKRPGKDQREVEIWYQMSAWLIENYPV